MKQLLEHLTSSHTKIDFLLYIGTDSANEPVYEYLNTKKALTHFSEDKKMYVCVLGKQPSNAHYYLDDVDDFSLLINMLKVQTLKRKKTRSTNNL